MQRNSKMQFGGPLCEVLKMPKCMFVLLCMLQLQDWLATHKQAFEALQPSLEPTPLPRLAYAAQPTGFLYLCC